MKDFVIFLLVVGLLACIAKILENENKKATPKRRVPPQVGKVVRKTKKKLKRWRQN